MYLAPQNYDSWQAPPSLRKTVGVPTEQFDFVSSPQLQSLWCWAAGIEMILRWHGVNVSQSQIVEYVKGRLTNEPGSDDEISTCLNNWAVRVDGRNVRIRSRVARTAPATTALIHELSQGHPVLLAVATGPLSGHILVLTSVTYIHNAWTGPILESLVFRDPSPTPVNSRNRGRVELSGWLIHSFLNSIRTHWLVHVG